MPSVKNKNIYLTGFMATGKTTIGRLLAKKFNRTFVDLDAQIEQKANSSISDIFKHYGEAHFRKLETDMLAEMAESNHYVVSLGGGAILSENNQNIIKKGLWIYLDTPLSTIQERLARTSHRPLAEQPPEEIEKLFKTREPIYQKAEMIIQCNNLDIENVCQLIINRILNL